MRLDTVRRPLHRLGCDSQEPRPQVEVLNSTPLGAGANPVVDPIRQPELLEGQRL